MVSNFRVLQYCQEASHQRWPLTSNTAYKVLRVERNMLKNIFFCVIQEGLSLQVRILQRQQKQTNKQTVVYKGILNLELSVHQSLVSWGNQFLLRELGLSCLNLCEQYILALVVSCEHSQTMTLKQISSFLRLFLPSICSGWHEVLKSSCSTRLLC